MRTRLRRCAPRHRALGFLSVSTRRTVRAVHEAPTSHTRAIRRPWLCPLRRWRSFASTQAHGDRTRTAHVRRAARPRRGHRVQTEERARGPSASRSQHQVLTCLVDVLKPRSDISPRRVTSIPCRSGQRAAKRWPCAWERRGVPADLSPKSPELSTSRTGVWNSSPQPPVATETPGSLFERRSTCRTRRTASLRFTLATRRTRDDDGLFNLSLFLTTPGAAP